MLPPTLDLGAMTLTPFDLFDADLPGFGLDSSSVRDFETELATTKADLTGAELDAFRTKYKATGFQRRVSSDLYRPALPFDTDEDGLTSADLSVLTSITEYATARGASVGFELIEDESDDPRSTDLTDVRSFGDQSEMTQSAIDSSEPNEPEINWINLTFRLGNVTGDVVVYDFTGNEVDVKVVERLGDHLQARIERVRAEGGPGLSNLILRLTPTSSQILNGLSRDSYLNIGANSVPTYYDIIDALERGQTWEDAIEERIQEARVDTPLSDQEASYQYLAYFRDNDTTTYPSAKEFEDIGYVYSTLYREVSVAAGSLEFTNLLDLFDSGGGVGNYELVEDFPTFGDESFASTLVQDDRVSFAAVARVDSRIAYIYINSPDQPEVATVAEQMLRTQIACLESPGERCAPMTMPEDLIPADRPRLAPPSG